MDIQIGADPELFVYRDGVPKSAHTLIPGTKDEPYPVLGGAVQVDGTALEFNIDPAKTAENFIGNINGVLGQLRAMVPDEYKFEFVSYVIFDDDEWQLVPTAAKELGCSPDFNAYTGRENIKPSLEQHPIRTAAGHIHIGWTEGADITDPVHLSACRHLVKALDRTLAIPASYLDPFGAKRQHHYGGLGSFRPKPYGCEYRVLGNFWLKHPTLMQWVFETTSNTFNGLLNCGSVCPELDTGLQVFMKNSRDAAMFSRDYPYHKYGVLPQEVIDAARNL